MTVVILIAIFMYKCHNVLPAAFHSYFTKVTIVHNDNTRFAAKHSNYNFRKLEPIMANLISVFMVHLSGTI